MVPFSLMCWPLSRLPVARGRNNPKYNTHTIIFAMGHIFLLWTKNPQTNLSSFWIWKSFSVDSKTDNDATDEHNGGIFCLYPNNEAQSQIEKDMGS